VFVLYFFGKPFECQFLSVNHWIWAILFERCMGADLGTGTVNETNSCEAPRVNESCFCLWRGVGLKGEFPESWRPLFRWGFFFRAVVGGRFVTDVDPAWKEVNVRYRYASKRGYTCHPKMHDRMRWRGHYQPLVISIYPDNMAVGCLVPKVFPLLTNIKNLLSSHSLLKSRARCSHFSKDVGIFWGFHHGKRLAYESFPQVVNHTRN